MASGHNYVSTLVRTGAVMLGLISIHAAAGAQELETTAEAPAQTTGDTFGALPGIARIASAGSLQPGVAVSLFSGYGFTGEVLDTGDAHHRVTGEIAASLRLARWIGLAVRFDGRYDRHTGAETDDGWVGNPRLNARAVTQLGSIGVGGQLSLWLPGSEAPSLVFEAMTVDALALASYAPAGSSVSAHINAGFRFDQSDASVEDPMQLSLPDRLALGLSDSNAVLLAAGASYRLGAAELLGEWSADVLVGDRAPTVRESPMRVTGGIRYTFSDTLAAQLVADVSVASTPPLDAMSDALIPIEPRLSAMAGLHYRFGTGKPAATTTEITRTEPDREPPPPTTARAAGTVTSAGSPIAGATVTIEVVGSGQRRDATTADDGSWTVEDLPPGAAQVTVDKAGYQRTSAAVQLTAGGLGKTDIVLERELPPGQLRGSVRSYKGDGIEATLRILPLGKEARTGASGEFSIDLPPGDYEVEIEADGYTSMRRQVKIEQNGVTILNADLRK